MYLWDYCTDEQAPHTCFFPRWEPVNHLAWWLGSGWRLPGLHGPPPLMEEQRRLIEDTSPASVPARPPQATFMPQCQKNHNKTSLRTASQTGKTTNDQKRTNRVLQVAVRREHLRSALQVTQASPTHLPPGFPRHPLPGGATGLLFLKREEQDKDKVRKRAEVHGGPQPLGKTRSHLTAVSGVYWGPCFASAAGAAPPAGI